MEDNEVAKGIKAKKGKVDGEVTNDFATNFIVLCAIYFPSVTGQNHQKMNKNES